MASTHYAWVRSPAMRLRNSRPDKRNPNGVESGTLCGGAIGGVKGVNIAFVGDVVPLGEFDKGFVEGVVAKARRGERAKVSEYADSKTMYYSFYAIEDSEGDLRQASGKRRVTEAQTLRLYCLPFYSTLHWWLALELSAPPSRNNRYNSPIPEPRRTAVLLQL